MLAVGAQVGIIGIFFSPVLSLLFLLSGKRLDVD